MSQEWQVGGGGTHQAIQGGTVPLPPSLATVLAITIHTVIRFHLTFTRVKVQKRVHDNINYPSTVFCRCKASGTLFTLQPCVNATNRHQSFTYYPSVYLSYTLH